MPAFKEEKGITIVSLVITVILLLILSVVGINMGISGINSVKDSKLNAELEMVQHAVLEQYTKYKTTKNSVYLVGTKITKEEVSNFANEMGITLVNIPDTYSNKDYYKLDKIALESIGIKDSTDEYVINYISGEVMNITVRKTTNNSPLYIKANSF